MKTWKLVSGIISCVLFSLVAFQSCAAGLSNALSENGESSGSAGILLAVFMLSAGIVSIASRKNQNNGANVAIFILEGIAALVGFSNAGSFGDLKVWSSWCTLCGVIALIAIIRFKKTNVQE